MKPTTSIFNLRSHLALLLGIGGLLVNAVPMALATITVANRNDSGPDTLRQVIADAPLTTASVQPASQSPEPITVSELGAKAGAQYRGDGLSVAPMSEGALLRCVFQKLEGRVTCEGLWLASTVEPKSGERFRVVAGAVGRAGAMSALPPQGTVTVGDKRVRCVRPGLTEEYSVSVDGVRQDFVVTQRPAGDGALRVDLDVAGAKAEALMNGARLVLAGSGRKLAYNRLLVVDAGGKALTARMEVTAETRLAVQVEDAAATYPVRIDPTFSDDDWSSLGGANDVVWATVVDGFGNLYIGGDFTSVGGVSANYVAKWNGSAWSALGSGLDGNVRTLAVSGSDIYVGGYFTAAGGNSANYVAKWNGSAWSALGSGMNNGVLAMAVSGSVLYAGGAFTTAGGSTVNYVAVWDAGAWWPLGEWPLSPQPGVNGSVYALAVLDGDLYVGGRFYQAGGYYSTMRVAKWDGIEWWPLGTGLNNSVFALAVSGGDLYAGGAFITAGGGNANYVAKWNGSAWSGLGSGMNYWVDALAVSGNDLYAGGGFTTAGGSSANCVAKWNGSAWSALGSGVNNWVDALAVSGNNLFVGGEFTTAGGSGEIYIAKANIGAPPPVAAPFFTSIAPNPARTQVLLTYTADPGASFCVLSSTNLTDWQTNTTVNATGVTNTVLINVTRPREFYRLRRLP